MNRNLALLASLLIVGVVHCSCLSGVHVLDDTAIVDNGAYTDFASFRWFSVSQRPVTRGSFAFQYSYLGQSAQVSHWVNIAIHVANAWLVYLITRLILQITRPEAAKQFNDVIACAIMLLWALHPLTTTCVTYISQRYEALASLGMLGSVYCWLKTWYLPDVQSSTKDANDDSVPRWAWMIATAVFACLAFGSKETSAGLPIVLLLCHSCVLRSATWSPFTRTALPLMLMVPIVIGFVMKLSVIATPATGRATVGFGIVGIDPWQYIAQQPLVYLRYLKLSFLPTDLVMDYGQIPATSTAASLLGVILWLAIVVALVMLFRRRSFAAWTMLWALLVLAPTSFLPTQDMVFEHRFYLPLALLVITTGIWVTTRWVSEQTPKPFLAVVAVIAILLSFGTVMRNIDYSSQLQLANVDRMRRPDNPRNLVRISTLDEQLSAKQRIELIYNAIEISDQRDFFYAGTSYKWPRDLADQLLSLGRHDLALEWYARALPESFDDLQRAEVLWTMAIIESMSWRAESADRKFEDAIELGTQITPEIERTYQAHRERTQARKDARKDPRNSKTPPPSDPPK